MTFCAEELIKRFAGFINTNMIAEKVPGIAALSIEEKLQLANELWDQVENGANKEEAASRPTIIELLEQRFELFQKSPSTAVSWETFKKPWVLTSGEK